MPKTVTHTVRDTDFIAESLEELANSLPPGDLEKANILRDAASIYQRLPAKRMIRVQGAE